MGQRPGAPPVGGKCIEETHELLVWLGHRLGLERILDRQDAVGLIAHSEAR